jgi:hypothetical protein
MKSVVLASLVVLFAACSSRSVAPPGSGSDGSGGGSGSGSGSGGADGSGGAPDGPPPSSDLAVHEWGTFTSVNSSTGTLMEGLHHEEETLPPFVYGRAQLAGMLEGLGQKDLEVLLSGVTQKLETPVIYFYGAPGTSVRVRVDFPQGIVSQWYPKASSFGPGIGLASRVATGFMEWRADLLPATDALLPAAFPPVPADDIWAPSRKVASLPVAVDGEREQFIFYRGVGAFELPFAVEVDGTGLINVRNKSTDASPAVFLLRVHAGGGAIINLGPLPGGGAITGVPMPMGGKEHDLDVYVADAQRRIASALEATGLYADESRAMVDTWSKSYFRSYGLRILYVVPRAWTDSLLPLTVEPRPASLVRTLVGRVEVLTPSEERELMAMAVADAARGAPYAEAIGKLGRLAEPKLRRVLQLADPADTVLRTWLQRAIAAAVTMP